MFRKKSLINTNKSEDPIEIENEDDIEKIKADVENGEAKSIFKYEMILIKGDKVHRNIVKAFDLTKSAAYKGNQNALLQYATMRNKGFEVTKTERNCLKLKRETDDGDLKAMYLLGCFLANDEDEPYDLEYGIKLIKEAAENGLEDAIIDYANRLREGRGVHVDKKEAARLYKMAADKGNEKGICCYANMLRKGDGIPVDNKQCIKYNRMALEISKKNKNDEKKKK